MQGQRLARAEYDDLLAWRLIGGGKFNVERYGI